jgi:hypothetical protein
MADNSKKVSELPTTTNAASTDRILILRSPASNASVRTITAGNLANSIATLLPVVVPNSTIVSNSVTITSNGTTPVAFFTFNTDAADVKFHAVDVTSGDITTGEIFCSANSTDACTSVSVADVGSNKIRFDSTPSVNLSTGVVTLFLRRDSAATSNVLLKYAATYY